MAGCVERVNCQPIHGREPRVKNRPSWVRPQSQRLRSGAGIYFFEILRHKRAVVIDKEALQVTTQELGIKDEALAR